MNSLILFKTNKKSISYKKRDISILKTDDKENIKIKIRKKLTLSRTFKKLKLIKYLEDKKSENLSLNKNNCENKSEIEIKVNNSFKESFKDNDKKKSESLLNLNKRYKLEIIVDSKDSPK